MEGKILNEIIVLDDEGNETPDIIVEYEDDLRAKVEALEGIIAKLLAMQGLTEAQVDD